MGHFYFAFKSGTKCLCTSQYIHKSTALTLQVETTSSEILETHPFISELKLITRSFMKFSTLVLFVPNDFNNGVTDSPHFPYN